MDAPTPWRAYAAVRKTGAPVAIGGETSNQSICGISEREEVSNRKTLYKSDSQKTLSHHRRLSHRPFKQRGWIIDSLNQVHDVQQHEKRLIGRNIATLKSGKRDQTIVYDRPISVINEFILNGNRDAEYWKEHNSKTEHYWQGRLIPSNLIQSPTHSRHLAFKDRLQFLVGGKGVDPRLLFRLCTSKSRMAAIRVQCWWRQVAARRKFVKLWYRKRGGFS